MQALLASSIDQNFLVRLVIYVIVLFVILVVYLGQRHDTAAAIIKDALPKTLKWTAWTLVLMVVMSGIFYLLIDP